ncbi:MAG: TMEM175 family protein [Rhodanobacter sp.]
MEPGRQRDIESGRLDNFVDGAFAFAITLLVISGSSLPHTVAELIAALRGIPAFAVCFAQLALFWHGHVLWRETSRTSDRRSLLLSLLLVFLALIFVFPLHLVFASFFNSVSGGALSPDFVSSAGVVSPSSLAALFACYGLSYASMGGTLSLLFVHSARSNAGAAGEEMIELRLHAFSWAFCASVGLLSTLIALSAPYTATGWPIAVAGFSYALLALTGVFVHRYRKYLQAHMLR